MAKPEKSAPAATEEAAKPKDKKKLLIIIGVLLLVAAGGAGWYFTKGSHRAEETKVLPPAPPKFTALEPFTVNLQRDNSDQFLQIGITLKYTAPELEEKIKLHMPEIRSRLLFVLSSKHAAELASSEGKKKLAQEIIAEASAVLGLRTAPPPKPVAQDIHAVPEAGVVSEAGTASDMGAAASDVEAAASPAEAAPVAAPAEKSAAPELDVLFTSFIIQ